MILLKRFISSFLLFFIFSRHVEVDASLGPSRHWGIARGIPVDGLHRPVSFGNRYSDANARFPYERALSTTRGGEDSDFTTDDDDKDRIVDGVIGVASSVTRTLVSVGKTVVPPTFTMIRSVVRFYQSLPIDAIIAQIGLVYCFAGGYYPTLFSSLQAARQSGWEIMVDAIRDLTDEAIKVIEATVDVPWESMNRKDVFLHQTNIVLKTLDPAKINQAAGALYTTWLGVSAVLEREYARTISLSLTLAYSFERAAHWILEPPLRFIVPKDYHRWVPVLVGWGCKAAAMNIAWRIQRVLTASTSAMTGGVMFARAILRMLHRRGVTVFGWIGETGAESPLDEIIGFTVGAIGFWTQIEVQYKNNFSFKVPFPLSLITWPFDWLEKYIQWVITKES